MRLRILITFIAVIISLHVDTCRSSHYVVHINTVSVNYTSIKLRENFTKMKNCRSNLDSVKVFCLKNQLNISIIKPLSP